MEAATTLRYLTEHGVKPSVQRLAVMDYLMEHHTHPTVDEIYSALLPNMPTLSKTTVYNTLKLLTEQGAAIQLTIDERNVCFDADTSAHAHFLCTRRTKLRYLPVLSPSKPLFTIVAVAANAPNSNFRAEVAYVSGFVHDKYDRQILPYNPTDLTST